MHCRFIAFQKLMQRLLGISDKHNIKYRRNRLRIEGRANASSNKERVKAVSPGRQERYFCRVQNPEYIWIVIFKRNRKSRYIKCINRSFRFEGKKRRSRPFMKRQIFFIRQKCTLADHIVSLVQQAVNTLKTKIGHAQPVDVRIDKTYGDSSAGVFKNSALLAGK